MVPDEDASDISLLEKILLADTSFWKGSYRQSVQYWLIFKLSEFIRILDCIHVLTNFFNAVLFVKFKRFQLMYSDV